MSDFHSQVPPLAIINTERLELRTVYMEDLDDIMPMITDIETMKWTTQPATENREQGARWLSKRCLGDVYNLAIREKLSDGTTSKVVGLLGCSQEPGVIGYIVRTESAGKGYATEALKAFVAAFFARTPPASEGGVGVDVLEAYTDTKNTASRKVLEKSGFRQCETLYDQGVWVKDNPFNTMVDSCVFRLARPGKTLEELGLVPGEIVDEAPVPPVQ